MLVPAGCIEGCNPSDGGYWGCSPADFYPLPEEEGAKGMVVCLMIHSILSKDFMYKTLNEASCQ